MPAASFSRNFARCLMLYVSAGAVLLVIFLWARSAGVDFFALTKDPFAGNVDSIPVYTSILSNFGIAAWCFTIAIQFFAAWVITRFAPGTTDTAAFLFWAGLITLVLMLDDFLMLHERMDRSAEIVIFGSYGLLVAIVLIRYRGVILQTNYLVLGSALACFALSMVLDNIVERLGINIPYRTMLEDAFKIVGIVGWAVYFVQLSAESVRQSVDSHR